MGNQVEIISAEAWVNTQPIQPTLGGTLNVVVTLNTVDRRGASLVKRIPQGFNPKILILDIVLSPNRIIIENPQEIKYTENLESSDQYTSIEIYFESDKVSFIDYIPIVQ